MFGTLLLAKLASGILLEKTNFFFVSLVRGGVCVHFPPRHREPTWLEPGQALGMLPQSLSLFVHQTFCVWKTLSLVAPLLPGSYNLSTASSS